MESEREENTDTLLVELSNVLNQLAENPHDLSLLAQNVRISLSPGMEEHLESSLEMVTSLWPAGDHIWLPLIEHKLGSGATQSVESVLEILELFERAEGDYFCMLINQHIHIPLIYVSSHFHLAQAR